MENCSLHTLRVQWKQATINRTFIFIHSIALLSFLYYRVSNVFSREIQIPISLWALIFMAELLLSFIWVLYQPYKWRPVSRKVFPERLPEDKKLPAIDVFICTADPKKEPTVDVMNTVLSAMSLDYPPEKISVYLSDDAGSSLTLYAMRELLSFAKLWIPFCRTYGIKSRCPRAYFSSPEDDYLHSESREFMEEKEKIKSRYELFVEKVERARENGKIEETRVTLGENRPPCIEVIHGNEMEAYKAEIPLLVYVSREKRTSHPHHFKAGVLNVLVLSLSHFSVLKLGNSTRDLAESIQFKDSVKTRPSLDKLNSELGNIF